MIVREIVRLKFNMNSLANDINTTSTTESLKRCQTNNESNSLADSQTLNKFCSHSPDATDFSLF
jgi:hypothetical protein